LALVIQMAGCETSTLQFLALFNQAKAEHRIQFALASAAILEREGFGVPPARRH
jgi:hypothetical protein